MSIPIRAHPHDHIGLVRRRLLDELRVLRSSRLALVVAPAGSGKTTLLAQHAAEWPGPVGWWQADPADTSAENVIDGVWRALPDLPGPRGRLDPDALLAAMRVGVAQDTLLVIDDAHCLSTTAAEAALEAIITRAPVSLHVLAAARRMPTLNLSRHELSGVRVIDAEQLRFRSWEAEYLLRDIYREPLPPDDAAALARRIGGWAAGFHMFHLSTKGRPLAERRRAVAALDGRSALTRAYLARTVLAELPSHLRSFLIHTCVFDALTPQRCEELLGGPGISRQYLADLERRQAFTTTLDGGRTYRYHEVLRAYLSVILAEEEGDARANGWYKRASALLETEGSFLEAARASARAEDWPATRRLLAQVGSVVGDGGESWWDILPAWLIAEDPWLILAEGRRLLHQGRLREAIELLRSAEEHFSDERGRARCRAVRRVAMTWLPVMAAPTGDVAGTLREATRRHPALAAGKAEAPPLVKVVGLLLAGNVLEARDAAAAAPQDDGTVTGLVLRMVRACMDLAAAGPEARQELSRTIAAADEIGFPWLVRMGRAAGALDGLPQGMTEARAVVGECDRVGDQWGAVLALAATCLARSVRDLGGAGGLDDAADLVRRCRQLDAGVLDAWAQALMALASAAAGLPETELEAQRAEGIARAAGVPGARAAAQAAATRATSTHFDSAAMATETGLPLTALGRWAGHTEAVRVEAPTTPPVEIWCFGGFRMRIDGRPMVWSPVRPRTRTAMRLLAMYAGRLVHKETIIQALWPDVPAVAATHNMHVTLSSLRTFLEPGTPRGRSSLIVRDGDAYELALPAEGFHDVAAFCAALDAARRARIAGDRTAVVELLRAAVAAYGGDLLPEDGPAEWVVWERETLIRRAADAAVELANVERVLGDVAGAVVAAQRCVQIDRYCDPGWRLLVSGYMQLGNLAAARRASRDYEEILSSLDATEPPAFPDAPNTSALTAIPERRSPPRQARTNARNPSRRPT